jgi:TonB family protein
MKTLTITVAALFASSAFAKDIVVYSNNTRLVAHVAHVKYPQQARIQKISGAGVVRMKVNPNGSLDRVEIGQSSASPILDAAALIAFRQWRFKPGSVRTPFFFNPAQMYP